MPKFACSYTQFRPKHLGAGVTDPSEKTPEFKTHFVIAKTKSEAIAKMDLFVAEHQEEGYSRAWNRDNIDLVHAPIPSPPLNPAMLGDGYERN